MNNRKFRIYSPYIMLILYCCQGLTLSFYVKRQKQRDRTLLIMIVTISHSSSLHILPCTSRFTFAFFHAFLVYLSVIVIIIYHNKSHAGLYFINLYFLILRLIYHEFVIKRNVNVDVLKVFHYNEDIQGEGC